MLLDLLVDFFGEMGFVAKSNNSNDLGLKVNLFYYPKILEAYLYCYITFEIRKYYNSLCKITFKYSRFLNITKGDSLAPSTVTQGIVKLHFSEPVVAIFIFSVSFLHIVNWWAYQKT